MKASATKLSSALSLGSIAVVFVVGVSYLSFGVVRVDWFTQYTSATMTLPDTAGLMPRSAVLLSGVKVGEITTITPAIRGATIGFRVRDSYRIPLNSSVTIEQLSALGEPYLEFTPTGKPGPHLRDGQTLDATKITVPPSIPEMARAVTDLLHQVDPKTTAALVDTFVQGLAGTEKVVPDLSRSTALLAATLLSRTPQLRELMNNLQTLGSDIDWMGPALTAGGHYWGQFGVRVREVVVAIERIIRIGKMPDDYVQGMGLVPFLQQLNCELDRIGPDILALAPALQPAIVDATNVVNRLDLGSLISQALHARGDSAALPLQITVK